MARTRRNRHAVPVGWLVEDGNRLRRRGRARTWPSGWFFLHDSEVPRPYRRSALSTESKAIRKPHCRAYRARCRHLLRLRRWDDLPPFRGTEGDGG